MNFSISMALFDYIPVAFFAIAAIILMRDLYNGMSKSSFALFSTGSIMISVAGCLKATWKLLYAAGICDFAALNNMFFPTQSIGFLLAGLGLVLMLADSPKTKLRSTVPPVFSGTFVFVGLMVVGLGVMDFVLCVLAKKMKKPWLIALFIISFVCSLGMGYLSTKDFAEASMNWIAEFVNVVGQGSLLLGVYLMDKNGLQNLEFEVN